MVLCTPSFGKNEGESVYRDTINDFKRFQMKINVDEMTPYNGNVQ